ncbi:MAG: flagellar hook protein FlgE [Ruminiclostridium sp.]|nr:flagellar hook protein FlgE [Ruminiclostridium sp.]
MMKSLYSGVAGMKTHNQRMDVIGNNVSNVNTTGYKTSTVTFKDVYYQTKAGASSGDATQGGTNPTQIGYGSSLGTVNQIMTQSGFTYSDSVYDCAIEGEGFFQVIDESGNIFYTRSGVFSVDSYGNLVDANGYIVLGTSGDPTNVETGQSQRINLYVPPVDNNIASAEKVVNGYGVTVSASTFGEEGNIAFTIVDSDIAYATKSGDNLTIYMDLSQDFGALAFADIDENSTNEEVQAAFDAALMEFQEAINEAIQKGGVELEEGVLPINFEMDSMPNPDEILAQNAGNTLTYTNAEDPEQIDLQLRFTADTAGEFANKYEINIKTLSTMEAGTAKAKWKDDVLTITIPENGVTLEALQEAINDAAGGDPNKNITVEEVEGDLAGFDFGARLDGATERLGLEQGADNFFADLAVALSTVNLTDGRTAGEQTVADLETVAIDANGVIYGRHPVHGELMLGRIDLVTFVNPTGLDQVGTSLWRDSLASGDPEVKIAGTEGSGEIVSGALEMSNVDLAQEFSDMIITQRGYQANSRIITVSDTMLEELINLKR